MTPPTLGVALLRFVSVMLLAVFFGILAGRLSDHDDGVRSARSCVLDGVEYPEMRPVRLNDGRLMICSEGKMESLWALRERSLGAVPH
jgi:hypothetical protein